MQILEGFVFMKKSGDALRFLIILVGMLVVSALVLAVVTAFMLKGHMTAGICCVGTSWRLLHRAGEGQTEISVGASDRALLFSGAVSDRENDISFGGRLWLSDRQQRHDLCGGRDDRRNARPGKPHR